VLEGINGCGKSSVYNILQKELDDNKFDFVKYPVFLDKDKANKGYYTYENYAHDRYDYNDILLRILNKKHVIADRYILSNYAYFTKNCFNNKDRIFNFECIDYEERCNYDKFDTIYITNTSEYCYENLMKRNHESWNISSLDLKKLNKAYLYAIKYYYGKLKNNSVHYVKPYNNEKQLTVRELTANVKKVINKIIIKEENL
jgi:thymidylate kinase